MSAADNSTLHELNDCGCCEGISAETPVRVFNRPGLSALAYRAGSHAKFKETMLARLSGSRQPALQGLNTRSDDDFSIALLDAWATVADVLAFYQERIANENYLRTATERLSVLELARLIGYELRPGVAARTYLAFTLEDAPGAFGQAVNLSNIAQGVPETPPPVTVDAGVKVQSVPGPGEQAQTFETVEKIEARVEWNGIKPRMRHPQQLSKDMNAVFIEGASVNLKPGDKMLIDVEDGRRVRTVLTVEVDDEAKVTRVDFEDIEIAVVLVATFIPPDSSTTGGVNSFAPNTPLNQNATLAIINQQWKAEDLAAAAKMQNWSLAPLKINIANQVQQFIFIGGASVFVFRQRAAIFGYNAPNYNLLTAALRAGQKDDSTPPDPGGTISSGSAPPLPANWEGRKLREDSKTSGNLRTVDLDSVYSGISKEGWLVLSAPMESGDIQTEIFKVRDHFEVVRSDYAISAKISRLRVESNQPFSDDFKLRNTSALVQSEKLPLAQTPITDVVGGAEITLDSLYLSLKKGQKVVLTGERDDLKGVIESELMTIEDVVIVTGFTVLSFENSLAHGYVRETVTINANVAMATHGETVQETLGGGDATAVFQRFTPRQPPLTYVGSSSPSGAESTLEIRVNDLLWQEADDFFGRGPDERIYITELDDEGKTTVVFGDGKTGARLPTGVENVKAKYRKGIGLGGLVKPHQLSQLMTRPLGVKAATNPFAAEAAQDREQLIDARRNAPLTVLTLGRVVSLKDYEDFARAFSGISKALATWSWIGERRSVVLTVAGALGAEVNEGSELYKDLLEALRRFGDPHAPLRLVSYERRFFRLAASLRIAPDRLPEKVGAEIEARLRSRYSFDAREFGQPVHLSEVVSVIQNVSGVVSVSVTQFYSPNLNATPVVLPRLPAAFPQVDGSKIIGAELLTLDERPVPLSIELEVAQ